MNWVDEFYVRNWDLYALTIQKDLWIDGQKVARAIWSILKEEKIPTKNLRVLDVPCGMGRVAIPLAKLGAYITGLDISPSYIKIAKEKAALEGLEQRTNFITGSAADLNKILLQNDPKTDHYDGAINIHTNIGYGSSYDDRNFLKSIRKVVKKNGILLITARRNKENLVENLLQTSFQENDKVIVLQNNRYDKSISRMSTLWRFYRKEKAKGKKLSLFQMGKEIRTSVRLYSTYEMMALLEETGWKVFEYGESILDRKRKISKTSDSVYFLSIPC
jgi:2-polyprenyl-3-methyl-5-hydroxy-6-metoxy-1,4-benzoquinol methylase